MKFLTGSPADIWEPLDIEGSLLRADLSGFGTGREPGLHLSTVIHEAKVASGERVDEIEGDQPSVRVQEGFLLETVVEYLLGGAPMDEAIQLAFKRHCRALRGDLVKQVTLVRDGIHMTPDWIDPTVPEMVSVKATRRTLRRARTLEDFEANFWTWVMQEKSYTFAAGLTRARWIVWWLAGDYSKGAGSSPRMLTAAAEFETGELQENWDGVCAIAARLRGSSEGA